MPSPPSPSQTDPYAPEPESTSPVLLSLVFADGRSLSIASDIRAMSAKLVRREGRIFEFRGDNQIRGRWYRIYLETTPLDIDAADFLRDPL